MKKNISNRVSISVHILKEVLEDVNKTKENMNLTADVLVDYLAVTFKDDKLVISHPRLSDCTKDYKQYYIN